ncbi:helix-turn-helix domain-containing protein [Leifsonia sp. 1010]|uniref:TetR/AcrR family transcriptional regulator n=1 Tax=Leifsonia sp. 1010 TaxID=2817769 RepID=UPI00286A8F08|nr:helix-turn-helix domain-containing protein [Leifsonia sp. 1010]
MSADPTSTAARRPRADAARNRSAILQAARVALTTDGPDASLEAIARAAGVGIGTLYRNFPTREDLVAAVYENELNAVLDRGASLLPTDQPDIALREFMRLYSGFIATKRGMAESLRAGGARAAAASAQTRQRVDTAVQPFLTAGIEQGLFRDDVTADDVTAAMVGVFLTTAEATDAAQVERLLDLVVRGLRNA